MLFNVLLGALLGVFKKVLFGMVSERLLVKLLFWLLDQLARRTDNAWDNEAVQFLKEAYREGAGEAAEAVIERKVASAQEDPEKAAEAASVAAFMVEQNQAAG